MSDTPIVPPLPQPALPAPGQKRAGMLPEETAIFNAWWKTHCQTYSQYAFNVRVGDGIDPGPQYDRSTRDAQILNTKLRIDALLFDGLQPLIVEVKYRATPGALGQVLCYQLLWAKDNPSKPKPLVLLLCAQISIDTMWCANQLGIPIQLQEADFSHIPTFTP